MGIKKKIIIKGQRVHDVGYRPFLLGIAESMEIERFFAKNIHIHEKQEVHTLVDSSEDRVKTFIEIVSSDFPEKSAVEKVEVEDYSGTVMKIENYYRYLTSMQLSKIALYGGKMLDKQDIMIEKQDIMIEKQDIMIEKQDVMIEKQDVMIEKQDNSIKILSNINSDTSELKSTVKKIEIDLNDTRYSLSHLIETKLKEQEIEIAQIKSTLARIQESIKSGI